MENSPTNLKTADTLEELTQVNKDTGVTVDYFNKYEHFISVYKFGGGIEKLKELVKQLKKEDPNFEIPKYEDVYSKYDIIVNEKSVETIKEINELVSQMNKLFEDPEEINETNFCKICNRLNFLLYGKEDGHRDIECKEELELAA